MQSELDTISGQWPSLLVHPRDQVFPTAGHKCTDGKWSSRFGKCREVGGGEDLCTVLMKDITDQKDLEIFSYCDMKHSRYLIQSYPITHLIIKSRGNISRFQLYNWEIVNLLHGNICSCIIWNPPKLLPLVIGDLDLYIMRSIFQKIIKLIFY